MEWRGKAIKWIAKKQRERAHTCSGIGILLLFHICEKICKRSNHTCLYNAMADAIHRTYVWILHTKQNPLPFYIINIRKKPRGSVCVCVWLQHVQYVTSGMPWCGRRTHCEMQRKKWIHKIANIRHLTEILFSCNRGKEKMKNMYVYIYNVDIHSTRYATFIVI